MSTVQRGERTRRPIGPYDIGILAVFVAFIVAMVLPWESAKSSAGPISNTTSVNGFRELTPRVAFILLLLGAAWIVLRAAGINFRGSISRSFVALVNVGLAGLLAVLGYFVASNDVGNVNKNIPGITVDASLEIGAILGLIVGVAAVALALLILLADRKLAAQPVPPQFATGPDSYMQPPPVGTTWAPTAERSVAPPLAPPPIDPPATGSSDQRSAPPAV